MNDTSDVFSRGFGALHRRVSRHLPSHLFFNYCLALPRFLGRLPYNPLDGLPTEGFNFVEEVDGSNHDKYLWCNAAFALAARLTAAQQAPGVTCSFAITR